MKQHISAVILLMGLIGGILPPVTLAQNTYRFETEAALSYSENDNAESLGIGLGGIYYFLPVNTSGNPLNEASFLERIGSIGVGVGIGSTDVDNDYFDYTLNRTNYSVGATYAMPDQPLAARISYSYLNTEAKDHPYIDSQSQSNFTLGLGAFIMDGLLAGLYYNYTNGSIDSDYEMLEDWNANGFGVEVKWVKLLANSQAINLAGGAEWTEYSGDIDGKSSRYEIEGDFYFTPEFSLGLLLQIFDGDDEVDDAKTYGIRTDYFFNPRFSLSAQYSRHVPEVDADSESENELAIGLLARF